ncbi:MAG: hypothetical protein HC844_08590, partial [Tabrizicola sp.]|nr:hypothetical protein [Tabrizicola sp.]
MFWTWLWGPMGLIIATPLTVCLVVIGHHVPSLRLFPIMFGDQPLLSESARLYDRLLAGRSFEFTETATATTAKHYLAEYYDKTVIPALALAQADREAGLLSDYQASRIVNAAWTLTDELDSVVDDELAAAAENPEGETETSLIANGILDGVGRRIAVTGALSGLDVDENTFCIIVTRGHNHDEMALYHLAETPAAYVGLIGSKRKIKLIFQDLLRDGISRDALAKVR